MERQSSKCTTSIQKILLEQIQTEGLILDIGGGGEGLVSRIEGSKVCAVDIRMSEIREAQIHGPPANWFVGDGQALCFQDDVFDVVTLWFSLGYMSDWSIKRCVLKEAHRVLGENGRLSILASRIPESCERLIFWGNFTLPDGIVSQTGYGVRGGQDQTLERMVELLGNTGFKIQSQENNDAWFEIQAIKI
jgi:ubiquinone/menaquinone biosynthesis C-methylase UbiE